MSQREEDFVEELFFCSTHDYILFFTDRGRVHRLKGYEISREQPRQRGLEHRQPPPAGEGGEGDLDDPGHPEAPRASSWCMVTEQGVIKRTELSAYQQCA